MGCLNSDFDGVCSLYEDFDVPAEGGYCTCDCDPDPSESCSYYESDYTCPECGCDLNVEDCDCE
jgi:hypothetical protein